MLLQQKYFNVSISQKDIPKSQCFDLNQNVNLATDIPDSHTRHLARANLHTTRWLVGKEKARAGRVQTTEMEGGYAVVKTWS